jgi:tetratricopeptide (TPR) repeat protein
MSKSSDAAKAESATVRRRTNIRMVQNVHLIWLDASIDEENDADVHNTIIQLRRVVNTINTFTNIDQCIEFLETINNNKACMIISASLGEHIMPLVHNMSQVDSIFILCSNIQRCKQWAKDWSKIKDVFTEITSICEALKKVAQECEHNAIPMSFIATNNDVSKKNLDQLDCSFMYTQILKEILLTIKFEQKHIGEFLQHCREQFADNKDKLNNVKELEQKYHNETPVWWYTCESFLYPMLNTSLRLMDVDVIIRIGFFIDDLHRQIEQLHSEQFKRQQSKTTFTVYRGQGMSMEAFEQMKKANGGLIAFNNFLSTSTERKISLLFAQNALDKPDSVGILFVMTIDPSVSTTPFASIKDISFYKDEDEILFSMHSVFRIRDIKSISEKQPLYQVDLTLTSDNDKDLRQLTDRIREETKELIGWDQLGELLLKMGQSEKAQQVYEILLEQTTKEIEKARIYYQIGCAKDDRGEYKEAITCYEKSLTIRQKLLPTNHPDLAKCYNNIGLVYSDMGEYLKALSSHEKALKIRQGSLSSNHLDLAASYNNIGMVYYSMGEYSKALSSHEKAFEIRQKSLPSNHPDLASCYNNIGNVYYSMSEYSKALSSHEKALEIRQKSLPPNHPDLASCYNNIGMVYDSMGEYLKALSYYEKALEISQKLLPRDHPDLASSYNNIGSVYSNMGDFSKALSYYEKDLEISQKSLSPNHPDLAASYNNIGNVYYNMGDYSKALSSQEKALQIKQKSLPPNHPDLAMSYNNVGALYENMGEYSKALPFFEHAVDIGQQSLPSNHPNLQTYRRYLDRVKKKL